MLPGFSLGVIELGSAASLPLQFVGYSSGTSTTTNASASLTALSGGVASSPQAGDIVIAAVSALHTAALTMSMSTAGYTKVGSDLYYNSTVDENLGVFYKIMGSTPDTTSVSGMGAYDNTIAVHVWRNADQTTPLDVTSTTATGITGQPNCPSITPVTAGAVILAIGGASTQLAYNLTVPSGMENFVSAFIGSNSVTSVIASYSSWTSGAYDPAAFGGGTLNTGYAYAARTIALRPA